MRTGRPLKKNINIDFLKQLIEKGFTLRETAEILQVPFQTVQYHTRINKLGRFKFYTFKERDAQIIKLMEEYKNSTKVAQMLGLKQPNVYKRYKQLMQNAKTKKERYEWLNNFLNAKDVEKD